MKHLCSVHSRQEADNLVTLFETKGIPLILSNVDSNRILMGTVMTIDIWVGIDSQIDEALALLHNPDYSVQSPADAIAFHEKLAELKSGPDALPTMALNFFACMTLVALILWVLWSVTSG